jgi:hypothetical protein
MTLNLKTAKAHGQSHRAVARDLAGAQPRRDSRWRRSPPRCSAIPIVFVNVSDPVNGEPPRSGSILTGLLMYEATSSESGW